MQRLFLTVLAVLLPLSAQAGTISLFPRYVQSFDSSLQPLGALADDGSATPAGGYLHIEFRMELADLEPDEDFWTAIFNVHLGPGLADESGWMDPGIAQANGLYDPAPSLAQFDSNGGTAGGVQGHWQFGNGDFGLLDDDLQGIIVEASSGEAANRQYGEAVRPATGSADGLGSSTLIGAILVRRTELVATQISLSLIAGDSWGLYVGNAGGAGDPVGQPAQSATVDSIQFNVPEPTTWALAAIGILAILAVRRQSTHTEH